MALSIVAIAVFGLRLGIDYKGGTVIEFTSVNPNKVNVVDNILKDKYNSGYQVKAGGGDSIVLLLPVFN